MALNGNGTTDVATQAAKEMAQTRIAEAGVIDNEKDLITALGDDDTPAAKDDDDDAAGKAADKGKQGKDESKGNQRQNPFTMVDDIDDNKDKGKGADDKKSKDDDNKDDDDEEFKSLAHYLDKEHNLKLNLEEIPKDLTREQEADLVSNIIKNVVRGANARIRQYEDIAALMEDEEVAEVIRIKAEGKSVKDEFGRRFANPATMDDESAVKANLQKLYPKAGEESIGKMLESIKKSGELGNAAKSLREQAIEDDKLSAKRNAELATKRAQEEAVAEQAEIRKFAGFVGGLKTIYQIPIDDDMKRAIVRMNVEQDDEGNTRLDQALSTHEGRVMASLGIAFLEKLIKNGATKITNRKTNSFIDKVLNDPSTLQSSSQGNRTHQQNDELDIAAINSFN